MFCKLSQQQQQLVLCCCTSLLVLLAMQGDVTEAANLPAAKQNSGKLRVNDVIVTSPINCKPVPHDTLWLRLAVEPTTDQDEDEDTDDETGSESSSNMFGEDSVSTSTTTTTTTTTTTQSSHHRRRHHSSGKRSRRQAAGEQDKLRQTSISPNDKPLQQHQRRHQTTKLTQPDAELVLRKTSWQCQMERVWKKMPEGTFPPQVQMGRCTQSKCMLGLYECVARKYAMKILRRVDTHCNPVPLVSGTSTYEEAWVMEDLQVTVGCECSRRRDTGKYFANLVTSRPKDDS